MDGNGDFGFTWLLSKRLEILTAQGFAPAAIQGLKARGAEVAAALEAYRTKRQQAGDSGKYSAQGLRDLEAECAAEAAGLIRRTLNDVDLLDNIRQHREKLQPKVTGDPSERLLDYWRQMEIRAQFDRLGLTLVDPATGAISYDTLKFDQLYRDALSRGDLPSMLALEGWPVLTRTHPLDPALRAQGEAARQRDADPIAAAKLDELHRLHEAMTNTMNDALQELPKEISDPLAAQAQGTQPLG